MSGSPAGLIVISPRSASTLPSILPSIFAGGRRKEGKRNGEGAQREAERHTDRNKGARTIFVLKDDINVSTFV